MESAGEARPGIWIATTECWVRKTAWHHCCRAAVHCPPPPHPLLHQPTPQQGHHQGGGQHTLQCWYQADQQGGAPLHQLHRAHSGSSGGLVTRGITSSVEQSEEMWRGRHCIMFSKTSLHTSTSHAADLPPPVPGPPRSVHRLAIGQRQGWGILPHLTTLIIQDQGLVPGTGAGGHTTLGDLKCI